MTFKTNHPIYGEIAVEESFWTGKKTVYVNGNMLEQVGKNDFAIKNDQGIVYLSLKGNMMTGIKAIISGEEIKIGGSPKWYELVVLIVAFIFNFIWGLSANLCSIIPIVGGAIGGGINGFVLAIGYVIMRKTQKPLFKILIGLGAWIVAFAICAIIGFIIIIMAVA